MASPELLALVKGIESLVEQVRRPMQETGRVSKARDAVAMIDTLQRLTGVHHFVVDDKNTETHYFARSPGMQPHSPTAIVHWSEWAEAFEIPVDGRASLLAFIDDMESRTYNCMEEGAANGWWEAESVDDPEQRTKED